MSILEKYRTRDGYVFNQIYHEDAESLIQTGMLNFCGCGSVEANLTYVLGGLELLEERINPGEFAEKHARAIAYFGNESAMDFFWYWCDKERLSTHGGSVPGWLTEKGRDLLATLREWKETA